MLSWIIMAVGITMFPLFAGHILGWKSLFLDTSRHIHFGLFNHLKKLTVDSWSTTFQTASPALHIWRQWWQPALQKTKVRFNATLSGPWKIWLCRLGPRLQGLYTPSRRYWPESVDQQLYPCEPHKIWKNRVHGRHWLTQLWVLGFDKPESE